MTTILSFNINGLRAINNKNINGDKIIEGSNVIMSLIENYNPNIIVLQEIKCSQCHISELEKYKSNYPYIYMNNSNIKKGYSGVGVLSNIKPLNIYYNFENIKIKDYKPPLEGVYASNAGYNFINEGRIICLEFNDYYLITCYVPNSKPNLERLKQRVDEWELIMRKYIKTLQKIKPIILCGDLNVAHENIDIYNIKNHEYSPGFTINERQAFNKLLKKCNLIDTFRYLYPNTIKFTYWSNLGRARKNNKGWRLDYFLISNDIKNKLINSEILDNIYGSDHAPILLSIL